MLRLITESATPENPSIPVRWCIGPSDRAKLQELGAEHAHVLLITKYGSKSHEYEDRQLVPLAEGMTYVGFRYPGTNTVKACIVWPQHKLKDMRQRIFQKRSVYEFQNVAVWDSGEFVEDLTWMFNVHPAYKEIQAADDLEITVDQRYFAPEPSEAMKWWVNFLWDYPAKDQCQFRKRAVLAFTLQALGFGIFLFFRTLLGMLYWLYGALLLARGLNIQPLLHPLTHEFKEIWRRDPYPLKNGGKVYVRYAYSLHPLKNDDNIQLRRLLFSPLLYIAVGVTMVSVRSAFDIGYLEQLKHAAITLGYLVMFLGAIELVTRVGLHFRSRFKKADYVERLERQEALRSRQQLEQAFSYLSCPRSDTPVALTTSISAIPRKQRSYRLYFMAAKRQVCRFYPG